MSAQSDVAPPTRNSANKRSGEDGENAEDGAHSKRRKVSDDEEANNQAKDETEEKLLSRIYLVASLQSVEKFMTLCDDQRMAESVTELVFVSLTDCQTPRFDYDKEEFYRDCEERVIRDSGLKFPMGFVLDKDELEKAYGVYTDLLKNFDCDFLEHHERHSGLIKIALPKLVNLRKIRVQARMNQAGYNAEPALLKSGVEGGRGIAAMVDSDQGHVRLACELWQEDLSHIDFGDYLRLPDIMNGRVKELCIGNRLRDPVRGIGRFSDVPRLINEVCAGLTHLTMSCGAVCSQSDVDELGKALSRCKQLRSLRVYVPREEVHSEREVLLRAILPVHTWPQLENLEIVGPKNSPSPIRASWLMPFLRRHAATLRSLDLSGTVLVNWYKMETAAYTTKACLEHIWRELSLTSAKMVLKRPSDVDAFPLADDKELPLLKMDHIASQLGVDFEDGKWDFGEYLMRL